MWRGPSDGSSSPEPAGATRSRRRADARGSSTPEPDRPPPGSGRASRRPRRTTAAARRRQAVLADPRSRRSARSRSPSDARRRDGRPGRAPASPGTTALARPGRRRPEQRSPDRLPRAVRRRSRGASRSPRPTGYGRADSSDYETACCRIARSGLSRSQSSPVPGANGTRSTVTAKSAILLCVPRLTIPRYLEESISTQTDGDRRPWLAALPEVVAELADRWSLDVGEPFEPGGNASWVAPASGATGETWC